MAKAQEKKKGDHLFKKGHKINKDKKNACRFKLLLKFDLVKDAYKSYCRHLADGKGICGWYYSHPKVKVSYLSFESYFLKYPDHFDKIDREIAWSMGYDHWENKVECAADRAFKETNPAVLQMIMRNKFHWDSHQFGNRKAPESFDATLKVLKQVDGEWKEV